MFKKLIGGLTSTAVVAGMVTAGAVAASVATATPALAASVNIGSVEAQMAGHTGKSGTVTNTTNCIRFAPPLSPPTPAVSTTWVVSPIEALASHGSGSRGCPTNLDKEPGGQSAVGISPTSSTTANTGTPFLLGTMKHYNNPITVTEDPGKFVGNLNMKLKATVFSFPYELFETPNSCSNKVDPEQGDCSDDILQFTGTPSGEVTINVGGVDYKFMLVSSGFTAASNGQCPVTPQPPMKTKFITTEQQTTTACLYGELAQKRSITLVKKVVWDNDVTAPGAIPAFPFTSTSDLVGSPWKTNPGNLTPSKSNGGTASYGPKDLRAGVETVTITEGTDPANWAFQDVKCLDGTGTAVSGVTYNGRTATITKVPDATSAAAVPITCTFTNQYARSKLTLVKDWGANAVPGDTAGLKILGGVSTAEGTSTAPVSGTSVSTDAVWDSAITTSESFPASNVNGYTPSLKCVKSGTTDEVAGSSDGKFAMPKYAVTCTYTNVGDVLKPGIDIVKTPSATEVKPGTEVTYTYTVKNTGNTVLLKVKVSDDKCAAVTYTSGDANGDGKLQTTETWLFTCKATLNETTKNVATATGEDSLGQKVEDKDTVTVDVLKPGIKVVKVPSATEVKAGAQVTYTYTVTNTGSTALLKVNVTDDKCAPVEYTAGDTDNNEMLGLTETWTFTCKAVLNQTTENTAVATAEDRLGQQVKDDDTAKVIVPKPGIKVVKTASAASVPVGSSVTYTYTVTNTGDIELLNVKVADDKCAPVTYTSGDTNSDLKLQVDETWIYTCSMTLTEPTTNTVVVNGEDRTGQQVNGQDAISVAVTAVKPVVVKKICPIDVTLHKPTPKKAGNQILTDKIKTKKSSCVLLKPVVLCSPLASTTAGEKAFCDTKASKKGRITVKTKGYDAVKATVIVRAKPKPGFEDRWKPNSWRKSWILR